MAHEVGNLESGLVLGSFVGGLAVVLAVIGNYLYSNPPGGWAPQVFTPYAQINTIAFYTGNNVYLYYIDIFVYGFIAGFIAQQFIRWTNIS